MYSDLLFYLKLATDLKNSFFINKYDPCVANKMVNWQMMTVVWNIDEPKVSHKDKFEVMKFSHYLLTIYSRD